jgi:hypothetical protein
LQAKKSVFGWPNQPVIMLTDLTQCNQNKPKKVEAETSVLSAPADLNTGMCVIFCFIIGVDFGI